MKMFDYEDVGHRLLENKYNEINVHLNSMRTEDTCVDLQFLCHGGNTKLPCRIINAHQAMFSSLSSLLNKLFQIAHIKQPFEKVLITLNMVDPVVVEKLIEYIYEGQTFVNHQQQHALKDLCEMLEIDLPICEFDALSPCPIMGTIVYSEDEWYEENMPLTFLAEFPTCQFYDNWNASKEGIDITIRLETKSMRPKREVKRPELYSTSSDNKDLSKIVSEVKSVVQQCANDAVPHDVELKNRRLRTTDHIEPRKTSRIRIETERYNENEQKNTNALKNYSNRHKRHNLLVAARKLNIVTEETIKVPSIRKEFSASRNTRLRNRVNLRLKKMKSLKPIPDKHEHNYSDEPSLINIANRRKPEKSDPKITKRISLVQSKKTRDLQSVESKTIVNEKVYCICKRAWNRSQRGMIGCDFCEEWFHPECLKLSPEDVDVLTDREWMCPLCCEKEEAVS